MATATLKRSAKADTGQESSSSTATPLTPMLIGETAGKVWGLLSGGGPQQLSKLLKDLPDSKDAVLCAIGWLAREHKIAFETKGKTTTISLA